MAKKPKKKKLLREAERLGIRGRSKMKKSELKDAISRKKRTKKTLYHEAKRLNIKGRSKMNKHHLEVALARRGY
jgi:hypothetical protein